MPRKADEMGPLEVSRLSKPGMHAVGGVAGLYLQVVTPPSRAKTWVLRVMVGGKRREIGLGGYPTVTLAGAKERARAKRDAIDAGTDPIEEGKARRSALAAATASALTFMQCAAAYIAAQEHGWKNAKHAQQWRNTLEAHAYPVIGKMLVRDVQQAHVLRILEPIWTTKTETASRLRGRLESVFDYALARGYRTDFNPARWKNYLDAILPAPGKVKQIEHHAALPYAEMGAFMADLRQQEGMGARALEFAILTAARSGEVRGATWAEIDLDSATWVIPAGRMKAKKEHHVPLSPAAVDLLNTLPRIAGTDLLFPNGKGTALSDMTLTAVLRRMGRDATAHGFRSTFRDWAGETTAYAREVIEHALAHLLKDKAEAAYQRGTLFDKRRRLMDDWAKFCGTVATAANVTPIRSKTAA